MAHAEIKQRMARGESVVSAVHRPRIRPAITSSLAVTASRCVCSAPACAPAYGPPCPPPPVPDVLLDGLLVWWCVGAWEPFCQPKSVKAPSGLRLV